MKNTATDSAPSPRIVNKPAIRARRLITNWGCSAAFLFVAGLSSAQTWNGGGADNNFGTAANWTGGAPVPGTTTVLTFAGSTRLAPVNNYTAFDDFGQWIFAAGAGSFTITGSAFDLFGKIENLSTNLQTVSVAQIGTGSVTGGFIEMDPTNGDLTVTSTDIFMGNNQLRVYGNNGKTLTFGTSTIISGPGATFALNQNSNVVFQSAHTYTGDTFINAGNLKFQGGSLATNLLNLGDTTGTAGATLTLGTTATGLTTNRNLAVRTGSSGTKTLASANTTGVSTLSGTVSLANPLTVDTAAGGSLR